MNYKLAKELKDAGFPVPSWASEDIGERGCYSPTLSELIEACGGDFEDLRRVDYPKGNVFFQAYPTDDWFNNKSVNRECMRDCCGYESGDTPEEAVARLWITLQINE